MYDPATGRINVTDTQEACEAAARPDVDPRYVNHCVECQISYLPADTTITYVVPVRPVSADKASGRVGRGGVGFAYSGVKMDGPAPVDAILGAHMLAPFDDCGGHVNPNAGYHLHAVTDCLKTVPSADGHAPAIGIAMDGYTIHQRDAEAAADLDRCGGHTVEGIGYHYHAAEPGANAILGCHTGETSSR